MYGGSFLFPQPELNYWNKITNTCPIKPLANANKCSALIISGIQEDPSNHTNGVATPLNRTGLHTYTQIQCRNG